MNRLIKAGTVAILAFLMAHLTLNFSFLFEFLTICYFLNEILEYANKSWESEQNDKL